ncbi:MAG: hypothetical protein QF917_01480 [Candidatus Woesearchaeota archaeon]|jgi:hypothetical protein|nr:hypothetical protein [Candidatus Woesearchaeota archaeon]MDP7263531.1 hypothetical protein [Candidatus Woesearchaeota archaeon]|tara:strand:+ start:627 stop:776 length:150 start_codon:yes stop_codon:yes gene_type:complete
MNINDLVFLMGKTKKEVEEILKQNDVIKLNLIDKENKKIKEDGDIKILQ